MKYTDTYNIHMHTRAHTYPRAQKYLECAFNGDYEFSLAICIKLVDLLEWSFGGQAGNIVSGLNTVP